MKIAGGESQSLRILLVEDHADTLAALSSYLQHEGHVVRRARSKRDALGKIRTANYDILLSNIGLTDGNGWDLLKEMGKCRPAYAVAMTGYGMKGDREKSAEAGFRHHLVKPIPLEKLAFVLKEAAAEIQR